MEFLVYLGPVPALLILGCLIGSGIGMILFSVGAHSAIPKFLSVMSIITGIVLTIIGVILAAPTLIGSLFSDGFGSFIKAFLLGIITLIVIVVFSYSIGHILHKNKMKKNDIIKEIVEIATKNNAQAVAFCYNGIRIIPYGVNYTIPELRDIDCITQKEFERYFSNPTPYYGIPVSDQSRVIDIPFSSKGYSNMDSTDASVAMEAFCSMSDFDYSKINKSSYARYTEYTGGDSFLVNDPTTGGVKVSTSKVNKTHYSTCLSYFSMAVIPSQIQKKPVQNTSDSTELKKW